MQVSSVFMPNHSIIIDNSIKKLRYIVLLLKSNLSQRDMGQVYRDNGAKLHYDVSQSLELRVLRLAFGASQHCPTYC